ncbi:MAG: hypothetical protein IPL53_01585 [Ignavibacteria bacterium]|nr:hypothetical protein [Ignavibacteria bacterium]
MDFTLKTDFNFLASVALLIIPAILAYFYYKRSALKGIKRILFTALRFLTLFFIFLLLSSPVISFFKNTFQDPVNVFLIDNSQSLLIDNRESGLKEILNDKIKDSETGSSENLYFLFSGNLTREIGRDELESISYDRINNFETNLTGTFYSLHDRLANKNLSSVTVISDGIINQGGNPVTAARLLNVPVNYILTGDTIQHNDLVVRNLFYNKTAFIESNVPVNIEINSFNFDKDIKINLYEEDILTQSKVIKVDPGKSIYDLSFNVLSNAEKVIKYKIEIEGQEDEITLKNNYREFFIKFVNNKFKVLVLSGGPGADFSFLSEEIKKVKNFESTFLTQKSASEFYEGTVPDLSGFDSYIFIGYPTSVTNQNLLNDIKYQLEKNNSSLIFFAGRTTDYGKLSILDDRLPFKTTSFSEKEEETGIRTVSTLNNEVFKNTGLLSSVNSFPNIFKTASIFSVNPSSETFLLMTQNSEPAYIIQNTVNNKSAAFLAYGLYKWRLNPQRNNSGEVLNYIITSSVFAITNKEDKKTFTIETTKPVYSGFENVKFTARITNYDLQGGEQITVKISGEGYSNNLVLQKTDNKYYEGEINIPVDGNYNFKGELISGSNPVESIENRFAIGENNFEYELTRADNSILNNLSNETRGVNFSNTDLSSIKDSFTRLNEQSKSEIKSKKNFELNVNPYYLGILIFLLCLEWFFRKRNNLP